MSIPILLLSGEKDYYQILADRVSADGGTIDNSSFVQGFFGAMEAYNEFLLEHTIIISPDVYKETSGGGRIEYCYDWFGTRDPDRDGESGPLLNLSDINSLNSMYLDANERLAFQGADMDFCRDTDYFGALCVNNRDSSGGRHAFFWWSRNGTTNGRYYWRREDDGVGNELEIHANDGAGEFNEFEIIIDNGWKILRTFNDFSTGYGAGYEGGSLDNDATNASIGLIPDTRPQAANIGCHGNGTAFPYGADMGLLMFVNAEPPAGFWSDAENYLITEYNL